MLSAFTRGSDKTQGSKHSSARRRLMVGARELLATQQRRHCQQTNGSSSLRQWRLPAIVTLAATYPSRERVRSMIGRRQPSPAGRSIIVVDLRCGFSSSRGIEVIRALVDCLASADLRRHPALYYVPVPSPISQDEIDRQWREGK